MQIKPAYKLLALYTGIAAASFTYGHYVGRSVANGDASVLHGIGALTLPAGASLTGQILGPDRSIYRTWRRSRQLQEPLSHMLTSKQERQADQRGTLAAAIAISSELAGLTLGALDKTA